MWQNLSTKSGHTLRWCLLKQAETLDFVETRKMYPNNLVDAKVLWAYLNCSKFRGTLSLVFKLVFKARKQTQMYLRKSCINGLIL